MSKIDKMVQVPIETLNRLQACLKEVSEYLEASNKLGEASTPRPISKLEAKKNAIRIKLRALNNNTKPIKF